VVEVQDFNVPVVSVGDVVEQDFDDMPQKLSRVLIALFMVLTDRKDSYEKKG